jgi:hypothetical protein
VGRRDARRRCLDQPGGCHTHGRKIFRTGAADVAATVGSISLRCRRQSVRDVLELTDQIFALTTPDRVLSTPVEEYEVTAKYQVPTARLLNV